MRSTLKTIACAAVALALTVVLVAPATADARARSTCANRLCTKDKPQVRSCKRFQKRKRVARCFIRRAARHFHQPKRQALYIAWRESRYNWRVTNPSSGTAGLYQFAYRTWKSTPYRDHSRYSPRYAPLAAMWMWAHGGYSHWT
jgi:Transglycosylase SLT domain